jgi:DNA-directed RNA polymerase beta subunit
LGMRDKPIVSFAKLTSGMEMPNLLDVQLRAFQTLLQTEAAIQEREDVGLERVFNEIFPISDVNGNFSLEFVRYSLGEPKYDIEECMERDMTYAAPLKATLRLIVWEEVADERRPKDIIEKEVYLGDLPLLTPLGTFIVNGAERVIVSQLHRSPGVVFEEAIHPNGSKLYSARIIPFRGSWVEFTIDIHDVVSVHIDKKKKFPATALLRAVGYSRDPDILELFFNRETVALSDLERETVRDSRRSSDAFLGFLAEDVPDPALLGENGALLYRDVVLPTTGEVFERGTRLTEAAYRALREAGVTSVPVAGGTLLGRSGEELGSDVIGRLQRAGLSTVSVFRPHVHGGTTLRATLGKDPTRGTIDSLFAIHNLLRPGTAPAPETWSEDDFLAALPQTMHVADFLRRWAEADEVSLESSGREQRSTEERMVRFAQEHGIKYVWESFREERSEKGAKSPKVLVYDLPRVLQVYTGVWRLLFQPRGSLVVAGDLVAGQSNGRVDYGEYSEEALNKRYDLGRVGRYKINQRLQPAFEDLGFSAPPAGMTALTAQDVLALLLHLVELHEGRGFTDDIDHLGNRRVRSVGELIANQFSVGLSRMARLVRERMSIVSDPDKINIDDLVNARTVSAVIQQFFGSSQLSQFMDQTNPLAELTHKRRLSALGPGGLTRERAGFEVRDVHYSHYGRMCPIETPEGPNIGLINSLTTYSQINDLGFIETPYRKVVRTILRYPSEVTLQDPVRLVIGERTRVFAKAGATLDAEAGRELFRQMILGAELAEDVRDWTEVHARMLSGEILQWEWPAIYDQIPLIARRGERITETLAGRIAEQPVNMVRVISRRAGAEARGVAPETIRNPVSIAIQVFKPSTAAYLAPPGTVLTAEVTERLYTSQLEGLVEIPAPEEAQERVGLDFTAGVPALVPGSDVGRVGLTPTASPTFVTPVVTGITAWLSANEEEITRIAQANAPLTPEGNFENEFVLCRERGDFPLLRADEIDFMDVAPDQLVSVAAALIPFLEHDDANRALMGSNMQRQAVPLLFPAAPLVGTGLEETAARDSGAVVVARRGGVVQEVTADHIVVDTGTNQQQATGSEPLRRLAQFDRYRLKKYWRTNQDTAINQRPLVFKGQQVARGEILADGASTDRGELALGRNLLVAFMPWYGHNFEDAIVLSERLVRDDVYTSIHIQELELQVRDTKRGMEEITREIPNVAEESLIDLDERGIIRVGARVKAGDILVGKITPKGETELSPEEKLLTAIFGEKAKDVKDSSLKVPPGVEGTVIDVKVFSRRIDDPLLEKEHGQRIGELRGYERGEIGRISEARDEEIKDLIRGREVALFLKRGTVEPFLNEGTQLTDEVVGELDLGDVDLTTLKVTDRGVNEQLRTVIDESKRRIERVRQRTEEQIDKVFQPDELPPGVVQLVKVYLAEKRKISVGDKMAGRHGNKGIIARIVPEEDMPFMPDGTPVDVCLNPLGVPSRMNVGQILETHLGWVARVLGFEAKTPVFQGASEDEIGTLLRFAGAIWAQQALGITAQPPSFDVADVRMMVEAVRTVPVDGTPLPLRGIGRTIDRMATATKLPEAAAAKVRQLQEYLVAAAEELVARTENELTLEESYPKTVAMRDLGTGEGLNEAIEEHMERAGLTPGGKVRLRDGRSGEQFMSPVTVGAIYMLKLSHLVDDKIHARSIGPYSLVTQQPLAGKAQFGGQRFGEMEVWALEAYGAAHTLQEILTVKSDDVNGRSRVYEAIVKGENLPEPGLPESFNVLVKELQALGISVTLGS